MVNNNGEWWTHGEQCSILLVNHGCWHGNCNNINYGQKDYNCDDWWRGSGTCQGAKWLPLGKPKVILSVKNHQKSLPKPVAVFLKPANLIKLKDMRDLRRIPIYQARNANQTPETGYNNNRWQYNTDTDCAHGLFASKGAKKALGN